MTEYTDQIVKPTKDVNRKRANELQTGDVIPMTPSNGGMRSWQKVHHSQKEPYMGSSARRFFNKSESHSRVLNGHEYVQVHK